jgi:hypothetical protein
MNSFIFIRLEVKSRAGVTTQVSGKSRPLGIMFYQPASFLRDMSVRTRHSFSVAFTFSPVMALAAKEGTLSW